MSEEELGKIIEQISATMGMDIDDEELSEAEKQALLEYYRGKVTKEELIEVFKGKAK